MNNNLKERVDMAIGKTVSFVSEQTDKASEYLGSKQKLYKAKTALDAANKRLDDLFNELGRVSYYKRSTVPGRKADDIRNDIKNTLVEVETLEAAYEALKPTDASEEASDDTEE